MQKLSYQITANAPSRKKDVLCVVVRFFGSTDRKVAKIPNLQNPDFRFWDAETSRFMSGTDTARVNNPVLDEVCKLCDSLLENPSIKTPQEFIDAVKAGYAPNQLTFGNFTLKTIEEMKLAKNKKPTKHFQNYTTLYHKLEKEGNVINIPIADVENKDFIKFGKFVLSLSDSEGRSNFSNIMKLFKQIHNKAYNLELTDKKLRYQYSLDAPVKDLEKLPPITEKQYNQFTDLDLSAVRCGGIDGDKKTDLYHDFCMFLYETTTRPVDCLLLHTDDIIEKNGQIYWKYIPEKKRNSKERNRVVYRLLSDKASRIIEKYEGQCGQGYVFPFAVNLREWQLTDGKNWRTWNNRKNKTLQRINNWLKNVGNALGVDFPLTLYTFRRSALTHACHAPNANLIRIAMNAGTSVGMLEKCYVSNFL